jgi:hypothetical protein
MCSLIPVTDFCHAPAHSLLKVTLTGSPQISSEYPDGIIPTAPHFINLPVKSHLPFATFYNNHGMHFYRRRVAVAAHGSPCLGSLLGCCPRLYIERPSPGEGNIRESLPGGFHEVWAVFQALPSQPYCSGREFPSSPFMMAFLLSLSLVPISFRTELSF